MINLVTLIRFKGSGWNLTDKLLEMQWEAMQSWARLGAIVTIVAKPGHVYWRDLIQELLRYPVAAQIGSDDFLTQPIKEVFDFIGKQQGPAWATAHRRHFDWGQPMETGEIGNPSYGLDCWVANHAFWDALSKSDVVEMSKLGIREDNAVCTFANRNFPDTGYDFTDKACLYHPKHEDWIEGRQSFNDGKSAETDGAGIPLKKVP